MSDRLDSIGDELMKLREDDGKISAVAAVKWARKHTKSHLHAALTWDDEVAGERWRVWEVRNLIAIHIRDPDGGRRFVSLSIDRQEGGYRPVNEVMNNAEFRQVMLDDALSELRRVEARYKHLTELGAVWDATHSVIRRRQVQAVAELPKTA